MNGTTKAELNKKRDILYHNKLIIDEQRAKSKQTGFGSQKVDLKDYLFVPKEWAFVAYIFYIVAIPYFVGALFLFLFIANADWESFQVLNLNASPVVWVIGYEIVAACFLIWVMILYLTYEEGNDDFSIKE